MKQKTVTVEISETGETSIDLANFQGAGCHKVAAEFAAGDKVKVDRRKPEYNVQQKVAQKVMVRQ